MSLEVEKTSLYSELGELDRLIAASPPGEDISRLSLECRRAEVERQLKELQARQGRAAHERTSTVRHEADLPVEGILEGLLPTSRRFEFRRGDTGEVLGGRLSREWHEPQALKPFLSQRCLAHLRVITFQRPGQEHRRYELRSLALHPENKE
jgi:hypothetical protein